jgi:RND family efflux transporter MFP subunit
MRRAPPLWLLLVLVAACRRPEEASASQPPREATAPLRVQTAMVTEQPMPEYLTVTGTLRADEESNIAADSSGKVLQVLVERGQKVTRGQVIATLDARSASLGALAAQAQAKLAQSQLEQARRECERVKHLLETGAISQAEFDRQTSQCTAQQWSAAAAEAQQQSATKLLGDTRIRTPFDGVIGERMVNVGQYVEPRTQIASIYRPDPLRLQVTVPEANLAAIKPDMPVEFTVAAFGEERFPATVKFISPNVRESTRDIVVEAIAPNPDGRLRPGMFAVARLELGSQPHAVVPIAAVKRDDGDARVFVVAHGDATSAGSPQRAPEAKAIQERIVQLGEARGDVVAVLSGVKPAEAVVLRPGPEVRDGARVE